jgi:DNA-binding LytR/AlgR family response regulator
MIAEFSLLDGNPVTINMDQIDYFQPSDDGTLVVFADGRNLELLDAYDAVAEVMNPEKQAGC